MANPESADGARPLVIDRADLAHAGVQMFGSRGKPVDEIEIRLTMLRRLRQGKLGDGKAGLARLAAKRPACRARLRSIFAWVFRGIGSQVIRLAAESPSCHSINLPARACFNCSGHWPMSKRTRMPTASMLF